MAWRLGLREGGFRVGGSGFRVQGVGLRVLILSRKEGQCEPVLIRLALL